MFCKAPGRDQLLDAFAHLVGKRDGATSIDRKNETSLNFELENCIGPSPIQFDCKRQNCLVQIGLASLRSRQRQAFKPS